MAIFTAISGFLVVNFGLSAAFAGAVANLAVGAALLGIGQVVSNAFAPQRQTTSTPQAQATLNQTTGPRLRGYGRAKLGGTRAFFDSKNGVLFQLIMGHHGKIDAFEQFYIGDVAVETDENHEVVTAPFDTSGGSWAYVEGHDGDPNQSADGPMIFKWPGVWTSAHRLRGIAYWRAEFHSPSPEDFQKVFPDGYNTAVRAVCRLSRVWDPRSNVTAWSDNAALCILDYLTHPDGYSRSLDDIDVPSFEVFADICDENVGLAGGGSEKRYRLWGIYSLTDDPQDVLGKMRAACDAEFYQTAEGKIAIRGGKWAPPNVTIGEADILAHSMEQGNNRFAAFNELKILYTSPDHDYQSMEAAAWENLEDQAERGVLGSSLTLDMVPSATQARRLAKIHIAKANPEWKVTIVANLSALNALGERTVRLVLPELEIDDAFFVAGFSIRTDLSGVELSLLSISEASYTWTTAEEGTSPPIPVDTTPDLTFPIPENLILSAVDADTIEAAVTPADRQGLQLQVQIRLGAGGNWQAMDTEPDNASAVYEPAAPGQYQARARWVGAQNVSSDWSFPYASTDTSVPVPPPSELMSDVDGTTVTVSWRNPNFPYFHAARVYRVPAGSPFNPGAQINLQYGAANAVLFFDDTPGIGSWDYFVTAEDASGNFSTATGPETATVV